MDRDTEIRRLKYLASRRSTLELDLILKKIAANLPWDRLTDDDLLSLARILEMDDPVLQKSLMARDPAPDGSDSRLWDLMLECLD